MKWRDAAERLSQGPFKRSRIIKFISEVFVELDSTTWPSKDEVLNSTIIVLITVAFFTLYMGTVDWLLTLLQSKFYQMIEEWLLTGS